MKRIYICISVLFLCSVNSKILASANPAASESKQVKPKKKCSRLRQRTSQEAHMANMEMCGKAVKMMSKIERNVDKFDSDSSDED